MRYFAANLTLIAKYAVSNLCVGGGVHEYDITPRPLHTEHSSLKNHVNPRDIKPMNIYSGGNTSPLPLHFGQFLFIPIYYVVDNAPNPTVSMSAFSMVVIFAGRYELLAQRVLSRK